MVALNMQPTFSSDDPTDLGLSDTIQLRQPVLSGQPTSIDAPNLKNLGFGQFGCGVAAAPAFALEFIASLKQALFLRISRVISASPKKEMGGVDTYLYVARVAHEETRRYGSLVNHIGESVSPDAIPIVKSPAPYRQLPVTTPPSSCPKPTRLGFFNIFKESIFNGLGLWSGLHRRPSPSTKQRAVVNE